MRLSCSKTKSLNILLLHRFSIHSNFRHKMKYIIDNQEVKLDYNINLYDPVIQAYLEKRWTKKNEIGTFLVFFNILKDSI